MKEHSLTNLEILDQKIKEEKQKVYSKGIVLLPGITALTCGAVASNNIVIAIGAVATLGAAVASNVISEDNKIYQKVISMAKNK